MNRLRSLLLIFGLMAIASLSIACGASATPVPPTAVPTDTPEPPTVTPLPVESQGPTKLSEVPRISVEELKERLDNGETIVVADTRAEAAYDFSHIAGAISVPASGVESYLEEWPLDQEIVLYCS